MLSKNYFLILIVSFFIAGFIFLSLPDEAYSQLTSWCCNNNSSNQCVQAPNGASNCAGEALTFWPDPPAVPFPPGQSIPTSGDLCPNPAGSRGPCQCVDPANPNNTIDCIDIPTGCCNFNDGVDQCNAPITDAACTALGGTDWLENTPCDGNRCSVGGPDGCCIDGGCDVTTVGNCSGVWTEGLECNEVRTCGPIGCCQTGADECELTNDDDCDVEWTQGATCSESGLCNEMITGCCVFAPNDCGEISEVECLEQRGRFEGPDVACSEVAQCNIVISPIPTLNQWGLIAMAGLLGLFSLFIIIRRHRYNVS